MTSNGLPIRAATLADLEPLAQLIWQQNTADYGSSTMTPERLRDTWDKLKLERDTWVIQHSGGEPVAYCEAERSDDEVFLSIYVASDASAERMAMALLGCAEASVPIEGENPPRILTRVSSKNAVLMRVFEMAGGYENYLSFLMMEIHMSEPPAAAQWSYGITVRQFKSDEDAQATYEVDEAASRDKGYANPMSFEQWSKRMNLNGDGFDASLWFLACQGEKIVGNALNYYDAKTDTGWIDHLGVLRDYRKQGIGEALLLHSFAEFYRRGISHIRLNVDSASLTNAPRLYEKVGMHIAQQYHYFRKSAQ